MRLSPVALRVLMAAAAEDRPRTATYLNAQTTTDRQRTPHLSLFVRAGLLIGCADDTYLITPAGREFAEYLRRLEAAMENL